MQHTSVECFETKRDVVLLEWVWEGFLHNCSIPYHFFCLGYAYGRKRKETLTGQMISPPEPAHKECCNKQGVRLHLFDQMQRYQALPYFRKVRSIARRLPSTMSSWRSVPFRECWHRQWRGRLQVVRSKLCDGNTDACPLLTPTNQVLEQRCPKVLKHDRNLQTLWTSIAFFSPPHCAQRHRWSNGPAIDLLQMQENNNEFPTATTKDTMPQTP
jgi:hypothetical protein